LSVRLGEKKESMGIWEIKGRKILNKLIANIKPELDEYEKLLAEQGMLKKEVSAEIEALAQKFQEIMLEAQVFQTKYDEVVKYRDYRKTPTIMEDLTERLKSRISRVRESGLSYEEEVMLLSYRDNIFSKIVNQSNANKIGGRDFIGS
jgi:vacuolar-type H+-ATPase catalytic subunit A/Vma1